MTLRDYQEKAVNQVSAMLASGKRKVVLQCATGSGKTIMFSAISHRYTSKAAKSVLILVHRKELLQQTRKTLYNAFGISAQVIIAGMRHVPPATVYVGMVESVSRRLGHLRNIGLVIIDEAHIAAFNKIHEAFTTQFIIGFTATPISANKRTPMRDFYEDIICGVDIPELIAGGNLCQNITFAPKETVDRASLKVKGNEFDEGLMSLTFSAPKYVKNTLAAYNKWGKDTKTIIFNCSISHSRDVHAAFLLAGYASRHLDSTMSATERTNILRWFENTPNAILNNVGILTAGFDCPSIETVIMNKATMSMPLWLQSTGRGSRPTEAKSAFTIIDMGGNALIHGDWGSGMDWENIFHNPPKQNKEEGVAPVKNCPECDAIISASARTCKFCGFEFPAKEISLEQELSDFVVVTKGINVRDVIERNRDKKLYYPFFKIGKDLASQAANTAPRMADDVAEYILTRYYELAKEWCNVNNKRFNDWHKTTAKSHLYTELSQRFKKWQPPPGSIAAPVMSA